MFSKVKHCQLGQLMAGVTNPREEMELAKYLAQLVFSDDAGQAFTTIDRTNFYNIKLQTK